MSDLQQNKLIVTFLCRGPNYVIVNKPPSVLCHHAYGSWKKQLKDGEKPEVPMLQRVRDAMDVIENGNISTDTDNYIRGVSRMKRRLNLVHRIDRGVSGCLLFAFADCNEKSAYDYNSKNLDNVDEFQLSTQQKGATATLQEEMSKPTSIKTYVAIVRGEGILRGEDLKERGWFEVNRPIKDEKGRLNDASTSFCFVAGQAEPQGDNVSDNDRIQQPRVSIVLARPKDGRWHQIRRHLNGLSHHILGDGTHGCSRTNKEWKQKRNLPSERILLHLARLQIPSTEYTDTIDCSCPLPDDMLQILKVYAPEILNEAVPVLEKEGIFLGNVLNYETFIIQHPSS